MCVCVCVVVYGIEKFYDSIFIHKIMFHLLYHLYMMYSDSALKTHTHTITITITIINKGSTRAWHRTPPPCTQKCSLTKPDPPPTRTYVTLGMTACSSRAFCWWLVDISHGEFTDITLTLILHIYIYIYI